MKRKATYSEWSKAIETLFSFADFCAVHKLKNADMNRQLESEIELSATRCLERAGKRLTEKIGGTEVDYGLAQMTVETFRYEAKRVLQAVAVAPFVESGLLRTLFDDVKDFLDDVGQKYGGDCKTRCEFAVGELKRAI